MNMFFYIGIILATVVILYIILYSSVTRNSGGTKNLFGGFWAKNKPYLIYEVQLIIVVMVYYFLDDSSDISDPTGSEIISKESFMDSVSIDSILGFRDASWYQPVKDHLLEWEPWLIILLFIFVISFILITIGRIINKVFSSKKDTGMKDSNQKSSSPEEYNIFEGNWATGGIIGVVIISFVVAISHHSAGDVGKHGVEEGGIKTSLKSSIKPINLRGKKYGEYETIIMGPYDIVEVTIPTLPHRETQFTHTTCAEIIGPPLLVNSSYMPKIHLVYQNPKYGYVHNMILSKKMKELMAKWEQGYVEVRFTLTRIPANTTPDSGCVYTRVNDNI